MIEKIKEKMNFHVVSILEKPSITNEDFALIGQYLGMLETEENQKKFEAESEERDKKFRALMSVFSGGGFNGM